MTKANQVAKRKASNSKASGNTTAAAPGIPENHAATNAAASNPTPDASGVAAGTVLVNRYSLLEPFTTDVGAVHAWHATDHGLERQVSVQFLTGPNAAAGAEAARRAALVSDSRLTKIIDVGETEVGGNHYHYVVTEPYLGPTLTELVDHMPLDSASARAVIGELATGLDAADRRGLHHVALRPDAVRIHNGRVVLTGLGVDADLGVPNPNLDSGEQSERHDVRGLAALAYFTLTGFWPVENPTGPWHSGQGPELRPAPRGSEGKALPLSEVAPGADPVLLELWDLAVSEPASHLRSPSDVVALLSPWQQLASSPGPVEYHSPAVVAVVPERKSVRFPNPVKRGLPGRIPSSHLKTSSTLGNERPLDVGTALEGVQAAPREILAHHPTVIANTAPVHTPPVVLPSRPRGIPATPIVLGLTAIALVAGGYWAARSVIVPFTSPFVATTPVEVTTPDITAAPSIDDDEAPPVTDEIRPIIISAAALDPYGDGERPENAGRVIDGDPSTYWYTYTYSTADFGGLKPGVGFQVQLEQPAPITSVTVYTNGDGGRFEVRDTGSGDPSGGEMITEGRFGRETTVDFPHPVTTDSIVLWVTGLPQLPDGRYRLELRGVTLH